MENTNPSPVLNLLGSVKKNYSPKHPMRWLEETIGWYGTAAILAAYGFLTFGVLSAGLLYQVLNITGAAAIVFISYRKRAYEPAALNAVWFCIGLIAVARLLL